MPKTGLDALLRPQGSVVVSPPNVASGALHYPYAETAFTEQDRMKRR